MKAPYHLIQGYLVFFYGPEYYFLYIIQKLQLNLNKKENSPTTLDETGEAKGHIQITKKKK